MQEKCDQFPMQQLFSSAGYNEKEASMLTHHLKNSGALNSDFVEGLLEHLQKNQIKSLNVFQREILKNAAEYSETSQDYWEATRNIPKEYLLALMQAGHQRYFLNETVVGLQRPTQYSKLYEQDIIGDLAADMGMVEASRMNAEDTKQIPVHIGVCIGATAKTLNDYLKNQKRIHDNSSNLSDESYRLFLLMGSRPLQRSDGAVAIASDNPSSSTLDFFFDDKDGTQDYITYLQARFPGERLQESHVMRDRFEQIYGVPIELAESVGRWVVPCESKDAQDFYANVANKLAEGKIEEGKKVIVITAVQPFNRTHERGMVVALDNAGVADSFEVYVDGGRGVASTQAQTILREFAKQINVAYEKIARENGIEQQAVDPAILSGDEIKKLEQAKMAEVGKIPA